MERRTASAYIAELLGTFFLVFSIVMVVSIYAAPGLVPGVSLPAIALVHVFALFMLIQTLGPISGGHFNPAVTIALAALKKLRAADAVIYIMVQITGAILATLVAKAIINEQASAADFAATKINQDVLPNMAAGAGLELIATFMLVWAIVGVAVNPRARQDWAALTIGATLGLGVFLIGPLTGAGINPARSIGPALVSSEWGGAGDFIIAYVAAPVVGGLLAAMTYNVLFIQPGLRPVRPGKPSTAGTEEPLGTDR